MFILKIMAMIILIFILILWLIITYIIKKESNSDIYDDNGELISIKKHLEEVGIYYLIAKNQYKLSTLTVHKLKELSKKELIYGSNEMPKRELVYFLSKNRVNVLTKKEIIIWANYTRNKLLKFDIGIIRFIADELNISKDYKYVKKDLIEAILGAII